MLLNRNLRAESADHSACLLVSLSDARMLLEEIGCGRSSELSTSLHDVRNVLAVLLVHAGRVPCCVASQQTAEAVLLECLLAIALERGGPEEMFDLVRLAGDLAPCLLAAEARE